MWFKSERIELVFGSDNFRASRTAFWWNIIFEQLIQIRILVWHKSKVMQRKAKESKGKQRKAKEKKGKQTKPNQTKPNQIESFPILN